MKTKGKLAVLLALYVCALFVITRFDVSEVKGKEPQPVQNVVVLQNLHDLKGMNLEEDSVVDVLVTYEDGTQSREQATISYNPELSQNGVQFYTDETNTHFKIVLPVISE